ncbi:MAG: 6-phosphofructokinase [Gammaproteobacteria bacterium]|nr:6-phosphofructokinase [Gammaproteobacteria bacterium]
MKKILLLTSGGDAPGMNAAIRAVVRSSHYHKLEIFACHNGYQGLVDHDIFPMQPSDVTGCIQYGGTILRSSRCRAFYEKETRQKVKEFLANKGIDGLVIIGGDGSFRGAALLESEGGPKCIGIPATIDNDIRGTEYTLGFDTARNTALAAIDKIRDTAHSSNRYFIVEVMGRRAGFLAVDAGIAGGAEYIITPEFPVSIEKLAKQINAPKREKKSLIIIVAEAGKPGISLEIVKKLRDLTPFEYRVCVLGHTQRGGSPTVMDREIGSRMGNLAVNSLLDGKTNAITAMQKGRLTLAPFPDPDAPCRQLETSDLLNLSEVLAT